MVETKLYMHLTFSLFYHIIVKKLRQYLTFVIGRTEGNVGLIAKETVEAIDQEKRSVTFNDFGGDLMKLYKVFKMIVQVIEDGKANYVKWIMEYEKVNENVPSPIQICSWLLELRSLKLLILTFSTLSSHN